MTNSEIKSITYQASKRLSIKLQKLDLDKLKLSEYNTAYLHKYLTDLDFYSNLYGQLLHKAIIKLKKPIKESTFIDYGGGSGFLSLFAKELGFKTVIYNDLYSVSVKDAKIISKSTRIEIDYFICGDCEELVDNLNNKKLKPDLICSFDVLEHIYNLDKWFHRISKIQNPFHLIFTTSANTKNPFISKRLRKIHNIAEHHGTKKTNEWKKTDSNLPFLAIRKQILEEKFPKIKPETIETLAIKTRGLNKSDILIQVNQFLKTGQMEHQIKDPTNTFDPLTGNWAENLINLKHLKTIINSYDMQVQIKNSEYAYNSNRKLNSIKSILNLLIRTLNSNVLIFSPSYSIEVEKK